MDQLRRIRLLEEEIEGLKREKRAFLEAIDIAANTGNFQVSLNQIEDPLLIFRETAQRIRKILDVKAFSFYSVNEEDSDFYRQHSDPPEAAEQIENEVDALIDDKTFAWALGRNKPVIVSSIDKKDQIILHSMATSSRVRGIFVGILETRKDEIMDLSLFLFSITIIACSNALESFELYRQIRNRNNELKDQYARLKKSQHYLSQQEELYRVLFEQAANSIILFDIQTLKPVEFNDNACSNLGYSREEFKELSITDYEVGDVVDEFLTLRDEENKKDAQNGTYAFFETRHRRKDGQIRNIIVNVRPVTIHDKTYLLSFHTDITTQKEQEAERTGLMEQLRQSQKMESIGTLAGGIAHDFNNILAILLGYAELTLVELVNDSSEDSGLESNSTHRDLIKSNLLNMVKAVERAKKLVRQILTFSRQMDEVLMPVNVNDIVKEALELIKSTLPSSIVIKQSIPQESFFIMGMPVQVHQIIINLCTNAAHAMMGIKGELEVALCRLSKAEVLDSFQPGINDAGAADQYVRLTVRDSGKGMSGDILQKVYEPYYTTKKPGEGTGLGLAVIHGIVDSYNGFIQIDSVLGEGTMVTVLLPEITAEEAENYINAPPMEPTKNGAIYLNKK